MRCSNATPGGVFFKVGHYFGNGRQAQAIFFGTVRSKASGIGGSLRRLSPESSEIYKVLEVFGPVKTEPFGGSSGITPEVSFPPWAD